jgi:hypothetical protein
MGKWTKVFGTSPLFNDKEKLGRRLTFLNQNTPDQVGAFKKMAAEAGLVVDVQAAWRHPAGRGSIPVIEVLIKPGLVINAEPIRPLLK